MKSKDALRLCVSTTVAYLSVYIAKNILSALTPALKSDNIAAADTIGNISSLFFVFYALGQLLNGFFGDCFNPRLMVIAGLICSGICTALFPLSCGTFFVYILWSLCGFCCSMLWGPLSKIIAENADEKHKRPLMLFLTVASISGTIVAYLLSALATFAGYWYLGFVLSGLLVIAGGLYAFIVLTNLEKRQVIVNHGFVGLKSGKNETDKEHYKLSFYLSHAIVPAAVAIMCNGIIRNATSFWIPTFVCDSFGISPYASSLICTFLPVVSLIGTFVSYRLLPVFHDNEHNISVILSVIAVLSFTVLYFTSGKILWLSILMLVIAISSMCGMCNMYFSIYVLRFSKGGRISTLTGFLDFLAYVASALANSAIGKMTAGGSWFGAIMFWAAVSGAGIICSVLCSLMLKNKKF